MTNTPSAGPRRVLHVVGQMKRGGIETWLMHVLRRIDRERFRMDFLVHTEEPGAYDEEVRALGSRIIACPRPDRPWAYVPRFLRALRRYGPYDVLHSHVYEFSGVTLTLARVAGVPVRIAHSHNTKSKPGASSSTARRLYRELMARLIHRHATAGLGCSRMAAASLFGPAWQEDPRYHVLYYGIDLEPFRRDFDVEHTRAQLGIAPGVLVVGNVGMFRPQKNHAFLLEAFAAVLRQRPEAVLLLVGDGPLRAAVEEKARALSIAHAVRFAGSRPDVPRLLRLMDVFMLPSHHEGLPLVLLEAQAAAVPCVVADHITRETDVIVPLLYRKSLASPAAAWARAALDVAEKGRGYPGEAALADVAASPFSIEQSAAALTRYYDEQTWSAHAEVVA